jgi:UDP-N-acetylmuramoylalanine--D-glutamate ligase
MQLAEKKTVVVGLGVTGIAVAQFLKNRGAAVSVNDLATEADLASRAQQIRAMGIPMELGRHKAETFEQADLIVLSPGVSHTIAPVLQAQERGVPVIGEIELASRFIRQPIVAVTGTNGKTTTTELLGHMLTHSGFKVFVGGNIGNPLIGYADGEQTADVIVAEISSFQLDTIETFRPRIGVLLNITADHLDRYPNFEAYAASKIRLFENQQADDTAVLNGSDALVRSLTDRIRSKKLYYDSLNNNEEGALISEKRITFRFMDSSRPDTQLRIPHSAFRNQLSLDLSNLKLTGRHNLENACAASLAALAAGGRPQAIQDALDQFRGSAHRLEYVDTVGDIDFFNDSKATNVDAVARAVECFSKPVVLIMGGQDKGGNFRELRGVVSRKTKNLIVMGRAADLIRAALEETIPTASATSMADAVEKAYGAGAPGDVVLLSPGCASFDMYANYGRRGDDFKRAVANLKLKISA